MKEIKNNLCMEIRDLQVANTSNVVEGSILVTNSFDYDMFEFYQVTKVTKCFVYVQKIGTNEELVEEDRSKSRTTYLITPNKDVIEGDVIKRKECVSASGIVHFSPIHSGYTLKVYCGVPLVLFDFPH